MKNVRVLLRVSSNQQLEADGDLTVQRQLVLDYINDQKNWILDSKEYFEGGISGYKNSVEDRDALQEALRDARNKEYDILVCYKDDRIGRRMWEIGSYVMELKQCGVDIYTVKDGCISPQTDDIMGQMVLALRYGNAQKSSSDTGIRVKDTAQKLVQQGKFMGGKAPFGYRLVYSGEISKHGRALKQLEIVEDDAEIIRYIFSLSYNKEYGSSKIAKELNLNEKYSKCAPNTVWKGITIRSILTNPIYTGRVTYKRREKINGKYVSLKSEDWIKSTDRDMRISIIDEDMWEEVNTRIRARGVNYRKGYAEETCNIVKKNTGTLALIDVVYCGYCGSKLTNGSKYNYWTIKKTGEKRASKTSIYKCQDHRNGVPHDKTAQFDAIKLEDAVFTVTASYIDELLKNDDASSIVYNDRKNKIKDISKDILECETLVEKFANQIAVMESHIGDAMTGQYALSLDELALAIRKHKEKFETQNDILNKFKAEKQKLIEHDTNESMLKNILTTWGETFRNADIPTKRVLINKVVKRIDVKTDEIDIKFNWD